MVIIKIVKNGLLVVYYFIPTFLGILVINEWIVDIQEYLTREPGFRAWAPTGLSYTILTITTTLILWAIFGWSHLLLAMKDLREMIPGRMAALFFTFSSTLALPLFLLLTPLTFDHYVAADEDAFYHDPYFGFEPELYPWEDVQVILDYQYIGSQEIGINYIIKTDEKEYDLGKSLLNSSPSEKQIQMIKDVDRIVREKGVPVTIHRKIGPEELEYIKNDGRFTPKDIEFVKDIFEVKEY